MTTTRPVVIRTTMIMITGMTTATIMITTITTTITTIMTAATTTANNLFSRGAYEREKDSEL